MSQYTNLLATINAQIKANGVGAITGPLLNAVLRQMVSVLGDGYRLVGVAAPGDNPGTPDNQVAYLAGQDGTYTNFGGITLSGEVALLVWGASWSKQSLFSIDSAVTPGSGNPVSSDAVNAALTALADEYQKLVPTAVEGHLAEFDGAGQVRDAGVSLDELPANFAACLYDRRSAGTPQSPYTFRQSGGDGVDYLKRIKGRTLVWNQLVEGNLSDGSSGWFAYRSTAVVTDGVATITPSVTDNTCGYATPATPNTKWIEGHQYLLLAQVKADSENTLSFSAYSGGITGVISAQGTGNWMVLAGIFTAGGSMTSYSQFRVAVVQSADANQRSFSVKTAMCIDLTLLGWVPSTAEEFRAVYPLSYYSYTPALLINNAATDLESTGFNQMVSAPQNLVADSFPAFDKNIYTRVFGGVQYYFRHDALNVANWRHAYKVYDLGGNEITANLFPASTMGNPFYGSGRWIDSSNNTNNEFPITFEQDCYVYFGYSNGAVTAQTEIKNACINLSNPDRNGTYEPYWKATRHLGLDNIQAKEVGSDTIVTINGLDGVGDSVDLLKDGKTLIKNRARVDLGGLTWGYNSTDAYFFANISGKAVGVEGIACAKYAVTTAALSSLPDKSIRGDASNNAIYIKDTAYSDAATFKAAMSGVYLDYALATPKEYELVEPIQPMLEVDELGTERRLPEDTAAAVNAPFESDSNYSVSVANLVRKLSE